MARYVVISLLLLVVLAIRWAPIQVPQAVDVQGKVFPAQSWTVVQQGDGSVASWLQDHRTGRVERYDLQRFERGDVVSFVVDADVKPKAHLLAGDTVAVIYSSETERQLAALTGDLVARQAALAAAATGEKDALIREAETALERVQARLIQHRRTLSRLRTLRARSLIAAQHLEEEESELQVLLADSAAAAARLAAVRSGAKEALLNLNRAEVGALEQELAALENRVSRYTLTAPISGHYLARAVQTDTLLTIHDRSEMVVVLAVPLAVVPWVAPGTAVTIAFPGTRQRVPAEVIMQGAEVMSLGLRQVMMATARLSSGETDLLPGAQVVATVELPSLPLWDYLKQAFWEDG